MISTISKGTKENLKQTLWWLGKQISLLVGVQSERANASTQAQVYQHINELLAENSYKRM